jgi:glutaredoxin
MEVETWKAEIDKKDIDEYNQKPKVISKAEKVVTIFFVGCFLIIAVLCYFYLQTPPLLNTNTIYYMYTDECPNCVIVKQYMDEFNIEEAIQKLNINLTKMNMDNSISLPYFRKATKECELPVSSVGVPFIYFNGECFIGRIEVINYLNRTINLM